MSVIHNLANQLYYFQGDRTKDVLRYCDWNDVVGQKLCEQIVEVVSHELDVAKNKFHDISNIDTEHIEKALELAETTLSTI